MCVCYLYGLIRYLCTEGSDDAYVCSKRLYGSISSRRRLGKATTAIAVELDGLYWDSIWKDRVAEPLLKSPNWYQYDIYTDWMDLASSASGILVNGCGNGAALYPVLERLAQGNGSDAFTGHVHCIDISKVAIADAKNRLNSDLSFAQACTAAKVSFLHGDVMGDLHPDMQQQYDLVIDNALFNSVDPARREDWANAMARLVKPSIGKLLATIDPAVVLRPPTDRTGLSVAEQSTQLLKSCTYPPFPADVAAVKRHLEAAGFRCDHFSSLGRRNAQTQARASAKARVGTNKGKGSRWAGLWTRNAVDYDQPSAEAMDIGLWGLAAAAYSLFD